MSIPHHNVFLVSVLFFISCETNTSQVEEKTFIKADYIRAIPGENGSLPSEPVQKGNVLIAYSDCYTCHKEEKRSKGPALKDIAERYPVQDAYVDMLTYRIISGGSGAWGNPDASPP